jgi:TetR/AcrR family transcriptional regulator, transcriptional repressor for nem operon
MSNMAAAIMDAAERRIRLGGFGGFSYRDVASDVGVKSSSVHYYFPAKETLAAAVVRRYTGEVSELLDQELAKDPDVARAWASVFRETILSEKKMCPCTVLGATALDLPAEVVAEVRGFFNMCLEKLTGHGLSDQQAAKLLSTLIGALVVANALGNADMYMKATEEFLHSIPPQVA